MNRVESERQKYNKVYQFPGYGTKGHGAPIASYLLQRAHAPAVLGDFGCGRGGSFDPYLAAGFTIQPIDHVPVLSEKWEQHPKVLPLHLANLWADDLPKVGYGLCTDVMEHIPEEHVGEVILNMASAIERGCLWSICHVQDVWGDRVGERLHMTIKPSDWWEKELARHWREVEVLRKTQGTSVYWTEQ